MGFKAFKDEGVGSGFRVQRTWRTKEVWAACGLQSLAQAAGFLVSDMASTLGCWHSRDTTDGGLLRLSCL